MSKTYHDLVLDVEQVSAIQFSRGDDGQIEGARILLATGQELYAEGKDAKALAEDYGVDETGTKATTSDART